jgi:hypothetical protein
MEGSIIEHFRSPAAVAGETLNPGQTARMGSCNGGATPLGSPPPYSGNTPILSVLQHQNPFASAIAAAMLPPRLNQNHSRFAKATKNDPLVPDLGRFLHSV